jgi:hypothetical protein
LYIGNLNEFPKNKFQRMFVYLVKDNMVRRAMRRIFESASRLDARYDIRAIFKKRIVGEIVEHEN